MNSTLGITLFCFNYEPLGLQLKPNSGVTHKVYLSLFWAKMAVFIAENKLDGIEEVGLPRTISANNHIVTRVKRLHNGLLAIGLEALDDHLLDEHPGNPARESAGSERL